MLTGDVSVQCFFMISGFFMGLVLNEKYKYGRRPYFDFISNRLLRLLPLYWVVLWSAKALGFYINQPQVGLSELSKAYLWITNNFLFGIDTLFLLHFTDDGSLSFSQTAVQQPFPASPLIQIAPAWSLGTELWFYLLAPFVVTRGIKVMAPLALSSIALKAMLRHKGLAITPWDYRFFPSELNLFLLGAIAQRLHARLDAFSARSGISLRPAGFLALFAVLGLCMGYRTIPLLWHHREILFAILFLALPLIFHLTKNWKWDRSIGNLSYPIYLAHLPINEVIMARLPTVPAAFRGTYVLAGVTIVSFVLLKVVEEPIERLRQQRFKRALKASNAP